VVFDANPLEAERITGLGVLATVLSGSLAYRPASISRS
jgi:hypothetical protein